MNTQPTYFPLGKLTKTQSYDGSLLLESDQYLPDGIADLDTLFVYIDGLPVPFFPEAFRFRSDTQAVVRFADVTPEWSTRMVNCPVACTEADWKRISDEAPGDGLPQWTGYQVLDAGHNPAGIITAMEDYNGNIVLDLDTGHGTCLIPFHEDLLLETDDTQRTLTLTIPDGLLSDRE